MLPMSNAMQTFAKLSAEKIAALCRQYAVRRLAVFGSAVRTDFDESCSDIDLLVEFQPLPLTQRTQNYLALREALSNLLHREVDLVEDGAIRNPFILQRVRDEQQVLYAA